MECTKTFLILVCLFGVVDVYLVTTAAAKRASPHSKTKPALIGDKSAGRERRNNEPLTLDISLSLSSPSAEQVGICYGGSSAGLGRTTLRLEYRLAGGSDGVWVEERSDIPLDSGLLQFSIPTNLTGVANGGECVQFRLVQEEHGGGSCNCWAVQNPQVDRAGTITNLDLLDAR